MGLKRYMTGVAIAALLAGTAVAQTAPPVQAPAAAGTLNPAAEQAPPQAPAAAPEFQLSDGILASVNDSIITGFDLRQRMLLLIAMTFLLFYRIDRGVHERNLERLAEAAATEGKLAPVTDVPRLG